MDRVQAAFDGRDWTRLRALCAPGLTYEDRRRQMRTSGGIELLLADLQAVVAGDSNFRLTRSLVGTCGTSVALQHTLYTGGTADGPIEIETLELVEVDELGQLTAWIGFDVDEEFTAKREARERWLAADPVAAAAMGPSARFIDAWNDGDRARMRAALADDLVVDDHRRTGLGRIDDVEVYLDSVLALWQLAPDSGIECWSWLALESHGTVFGTRRAGRLADGGTFESEYLVLAVPERGRIGRVEMFELDAVDAALARFAELRPDPLRLPPNAATRVSARMLEAAPGGDWAALRALAGTDFVYEDRGKRALVCGDVATWIASLEFMYSLPGFQARFELIGTVGDRLALERMLWTGGPDGDAFEVEHIRLLEVDADGRLRTSILFDADDRPVAFAEALERLVSGEAATGGLAPFVAAGRAFQQHDWEAMRQALVSDFVFDDHRILGLGKLDGDQWVASLRALADLSPDVATEVSRVLTWNRHGGVLMVHLRGTVPDGGPFENVLIGAILTAGNRIRHYAAFDLGDADRALAHFAALSDEHHR
jgi:hypothetical protein